MSIKAQQVLSKDEEKPIPKLIDFPIDHLPGAHHPHCSRHSHHLLWILGRPLCLGCTCMYAGMVLGLFVAFAVVRLQLSFVYWSILHYVFLLGPTFLQPWLQHKAFKIISRLMLGVSIISYWISGVLLYRPPINGWLFRIGLIAAFLVLYKLLTFLRKQHSDEPCKTCPQGIFPTCDWNMNRDVALEKEKMKFKAFGKNRNIDSLLRGFNNKNFKILFIQIGG